MDGDIILFRRWLRANDISPATGYRLVKAGKLHLTKLGARTYITASEAARFVAALEKGAAS